MKLLINTPLTWSTTFKQGDSEWSVEELKSHYEEIAVVLKRYTVYGTFVIDESGASFTIIEQKVTLEEADMSDLFTNALSMLFDILLRPAALGADFSMVIESAVATGQ